MKVIISAPFGHFQRPGNPGEPSTYPVITPTAFQGLIDSVYWHPGHTVQVKTISLLNPIKYTTETVTQLDHHSGKPWLRTYELLVEPRYGVEFWLACEENVDSCKRVGQLARKLLAGEHYYQPAMGISDYPATIELLGKNEVMEKPQDISMGIGRMPHYWTWEKTPKPTKKSFARRTTAMTEARPLERVKGVPVMFNAEMVKGVITVDPYPSMGANGYAD